MTSAHGLKRGARAMVVLMGAGAAMLGGCALLTPEQAAPAPAWAPSGTRPQDDSQSLLWYHRWLRGLPAAQAAREQDVAHRAYTRSASDFDRLRYALALSVSAGDAEAWGRALELVEPVAKNTASPLQPLAVLLQVQFAEQKRVCAAAAELQEKLDALKSLEKSMTERGTKK